MKKNIFNCFLIIILILFSACSNDANNFKSSNSKDIADKAFENSIDLNGINANKKIEEEQGQKIIMNSVALTQIADTLNIKLAGIPTSSLSKIPETYKDIYQIGMPMNPNMEVIKSINPTIVYSPDSLYDWLEEGFKKHNIKNKYVNLRSVESLYDVTEKLAKDYNKLEKYEQLKIEKETFFNNYSEKIKEKNKPKVLILMGLPGSYVGATENSYVGNLVKIAGGENIIKSDKEFEQINMEQILSQNPDYILRASHAMPDVVEKMFEAEFNENKSWQHFKAVKNNKVYNLDYKVFSMTAQFNYPEGLEHLAKIFYS